jgi:hypothetical protein
MAWGEQLGRSLAEDIAEHIPVWAFEWVRLRPSRDRAFPFVSQPSMTTLALAGQRQPASIPTQSLQNTEIPLLLGDLGLARLPRCPCSQFVAPPARASLAIDGQRMQR